MLLHVACANCLSSVTIISVHCGEKQGVFTNQRFRDACINPLSSSIKLQFRLLCFHTFLTEVVREAVKISIEFNLSDHVLNSHDLPN